MIASNVAIAKFLEAHGRSGIRRVVREPERWARIVELAKQYGTTLPDDARFARARALPRRPAARPIPERFPDLSLSIVKLMGPGIYALDLPGKDPGGHFGLATHDYTHATAPNRRYADLVTQRLVKAALADAPAPYTNDELADVAAHCTEREDAENKVERTVRKTVAALLLHDQHRPDVRRDRHGGESQGDVRAHAPPAGGGDGGAKRGEVRRRRQGEGQARRRGSVQGLHRFRRAELSAQAESQVSDLRSVRALIAARHLGCGSEPCLEHELEQEL